MLTERIKELADGMDGELRQIYRHLHSWPELRGEERETSVYLKEQMERLGLEVTTGWNESGICAFLAGTQGDKTLLIQADMDALPVQEKTGLFYASCHEGKMHACGHDAHMTMVLGAARILSEMRNNLKGNVKFVFQPAEDIPASAGCRLEQSEILNNPKVNAAMGIHVWPDIPTGQYGVRGGKVMAAVDSFRLELKGRGSHGAMPEKCIDIIDMGHEICDAFQTVPIRFAGALNPVVVSVTRFSAGTCNNAFSDTGILEGTTYSYDEKIRIRLPEVLEHIVQAVTEKYGGTYDFQYKRISPAVVNDGIMAALAIRSLKTLYGSDVITPTPYPAMIGENFAAYMQEIPGVFIWIGTGNTEKNCVYPLHNPQFTIDEDILSKASAAIAQMTFDYLNR